MTVQLKQMALSLVLGVIFLGAPSHADHFIVVSSDSGVTFGNAFNVTVGDTLTVDFFVNETSPNTELVNDGLIGFGMDLDHTAGLGSISNANPNGFFDVDNHDVRSSTGFEWEYFETANSGLKGTSLLLGSMDYTTTGLGTTTFTISDRLVGSGFNNASWFSPTGGFIDNSIFGSEGTDTYSFTVTATAVPEPSSLVFLPAMACLVFRRSRRRMV